MMNEAEQAAAVRALDKLAENFDRAGINRADLAACVMGWAMAETIAAAHGAELAECFRTFAARIDAGDLALLPMAGRA